MTPQEAKRKRREHRKAIRNEEKLAERASKENLLAAVKAYHLKCVEMHKALKDVRDLLHSVYDHSEQILDEEPSFPSRETLDEIVKDIDKILTPAPRNIPAESIPAQVRLQATLDEMKANGEFPAGTEGRAM